MRLLLDTHVLIWAAIEPGRISRRAAAAIEDPGNDLLLSAVSAYEVAYKRDRDPALSGLPVDLRSSVASRGLAWLDITPSHATEAGRLPRHHGDPFDRILIAQARAEGAVVVSADRRFPAYGVSVLW
jgi:PIN domain nuclease of toxin-antitoxin system